MTILAKGVIRGGQVVVQEPINLPDGSEVIVSKLPSSEMTPDVADHRPPTVADERREALQQLIGIWKTDQPPTDEEVEEIIDQERMKKYG